jgi:hypothetical protein
MHIYRSVGDKPAAMRIVWRIRNGLMVEHLLVKCRVYWPAHQRHINANTLP